MAVFLPKQKIQAKVENPKFMLLFGKPKMGKTTIVAALEDNLIIDMEGGSLYMEAMSVQARTVAELGEIATALTQEIQATGKFPYNTITLDSGTKLEEIVKPFALQLYQATPMGKNYKDDILKLPNGAGYMYVREAFEKVLDMFKNLCENLILICHVKDSMINKDGKEMSEMTIDLSGKLGRIVSSQADAIGYVYRNKNKTMLNFNGGGDCIVEARAPHLRGKEFIVAESDENNNVKVDWKQIYLPTDTLSNTTTYSLTNQEIEQPVQQAA